MLVSCPFSWKCFNHVERGFTKLLVFLERVSLLNPRVRTNFVAFPLEPGKGLEVRFEFGGLVNNCSAAAGRAPNWTGRTLNSSYFCVSMLISCPPRRSSLTICSKVLGDDRFANADVLPPDGNVCKGPIWGQDSLIDSGQGISRIYVTHVCLWHVRNCQKSPFL